MNDELKAIDYQILDSLWEMCGGIQRFIHVDKVKTFLLSNYNKSISPPIYKTSLERLESLELIYTKRKRSGIYQIKITDSGQTTNFQNKPGIPQFYTRNLCALNNKELQEFKKELHARLATSGVESRDYTLTKDKISEIQDFENVNTNKKTRIIAIISLIIAVVAAFGVDLFSVIKTFINILK